MAKIHKPKQIDPAGFYEKTPREKILNILEYAVLAPSTHNTQPWQFKLGPNSCQVFIDHRRQLPAADTLKRDMYISLGALLKNLELAAVAFDVLDELKLTNQETDLVAEVSFKNLDKKRGRLISAQTKTLDSIRHRSNYRGPFKPLKITQEFRTVLNSGDGQVKTYLINNPATIKELARLTAEGLRQAYNNPAFRREIASWIKPNSSRQKKGIPGYSLRMPMLASHIIPKIMRIKDIGPKLAGLNYKSFVTATAAIVIAAPEQKPSTWLHIGQLSQEIFLEVDKLGGSSSIYVAAVETESLNKEVKKAAGITGPANPQFLFCIGRPVLPKVYSPRESVKSKLKN